MISAIFYVIVGIVDIIEGLQNFLTIFFVLITKALLRLFFVDDLLQFSLPGDEVLIPVVCLQIFKTLV